MKNKHEIAKLALSSLLLAAAVVPVDGQAGMQADGIFLAAGCPAHGCPASKRGNLYKGEDSEEKNENVSHSSSNLSENQLLNSLSPQGRSIYMSLDPEGKALAIQLANQDSYKDKDLAVKEAQRRMSERRGSFNR